MQRYSLLFLLLLLLGCRNDRQTVTARSETDCIQDIIAEDDSLGRYRNHACKESSLSTTIAQYAVELQALDFSDCPTAFQQAFIQHSIAWSALLPVVERYDTLRGEMHDLFAQLEQSQDSTVFKTLLAEVWATWEEVEVAMDE